MGSIFITRSNNFRKLVEAHRGLYLHGAAMGELPTAFALCREVTLSQCHVFSGRLKT